MNIVNRGTSSFIALTCPNPQLTAKHVNTILFVDAPITRIHPSSGVLCFNAAMKSVLLLLRKAARPSRGSSRVVDMAFVDACVMVSFKVDNLYVLNTSGHKNISAASCRRKPTRGISKLRVHSRGGEF